MGRNVFWYAKKMIKAIIFDFDGTLADSQNTIMAIFQELIHRPAPLASTEIQELREHGARGVLRQLGIKPWQVPGLLVRGRELFAQRIASVPLFAGVPAVIATLAKQYDLYVVSTNQDAAIAELLNDNHALHYFQKIYGNIGVWGKARVLKKLLKKHQYQPQECIYVGDELRDIIAARQAGIRIVAVGWGFNSPLALQKAQPDGLADTVQILPTIIAGLREV